MGSFLLAELCIRLADVRLNPRGISGHTTQVSKNQTFTDFLNKPRGPPHYFAFHASCSLSLSSCSGFCCASRRLLHFVCQLYCVFAVFSAFFFFFFFKK